MRENKNNLAVTIINTFLKKFLLLYKVYQSLDKKITR